MVNRHDPETDVRTPLAIVNDVQENHAAHMVNCPTCTWAMCEHYPCDCGRYASPAPRTEP